MSGGNEMANGKFEVFSTDGVRTYSHAECKRYIQAASFARAVRKAFPNRIVLVDIPKPLRA